MALNLPNTDQEQLNVQPNEFVTAPILNRANNRLLENDQQLTTWIDNIQSTTITNGLSGSIKAEGEGILEVDFDSLTSNIPSNVIIGAILPFSGNPFAIPSFSLLCDGSEISRTTYSNLFSVIGTIYGAGDGSTTFNVPDLRGRSIIGIDNMGGTDGGVISGSLIPNRSSDSWDETLGGTAGEDLHQLTESELATHNHNLKESTYCPSNCVIGSDPGTDDWIAGDDVYSNTSGDDGFHNTIHPVITLNYIIIAKLN
jgi:microcystin-dependent protein